EALLSDWKGAEQASGSSARAARARLLLQRTDAPGQLRIATARGAVWVTRAGAQHALPAGPDSSPLAPGDALSTGAAPLVVLITEDDTRMVCSPGTELTWRGPSDTVATMDMA